MEPKNLLFTGETLAQLLKQFTTSDGKPLYRALVQGDGAVKKEYLVWLNNRPVKKQHSLDIPRYRGDVDFKVCRRRVRDG